MVNIKVIVIKNPVKDLQNLCPYPPTQRAEVTTNLSLITTDVQAGPFAEGRLTLVSLPSTFVLFLILSLLLLSPHAAKKNERIRKRIFSDDQYYRTHANKGHSYHSKIAILAL